MARPAKVGEKKVGGFSISTTPTEKASIKVRSRDLGFKNAGAYFLALHEAELRLGLEVRRNFNGERWFMASSATLDSLKADVPEDHTVDDAIRQRWEDRMDAKTTSGTPLKLIHEYETPAGKEPRRAGDLGEGRSPDDQTKPAKGKIKPKEGGDEATGTA